jgi:putative aminopeptidase FrvX
MGVPALLRALLTAPGPSGRETAAAEVWRRAAREFADVTTDAHGSSAALVRGTGSGPRLAVFGHIDEIGLIVTHVDDEGFVYFRGVGGWDAEVLRGQRVELLTSGGSIPGVVGRAYRGRLRRGEDPKRTELEELHIDMGAGTRDEAHELLRIGDVAVIAGEPVQLASGRLASRSLDDRLGAYVALEAARLVAEAGGAPGDVIAVAATQEEVGDFGGARTSAFRLEPDVALAVDVTDASDIPKGDHKDAGRKALGSGPAIDRGSTISPKVFDLLVEAAEAEGIEYAIEISTGSTRTDMDAVHISRSGIASGLISIATRYIHTPVETCALSDVESAARLVAAFAQRLAPGLDLSR